MPAHSLRLEGVDFAFGPCDIFRDLNLVLRPGWSGLVGANGSGKTTLLRLVAGSLAPSAGSIRRNGLCTHHCMQSSPLLADALESFAWAWDRSAVRLRASLRLTPEELSRWSTLSPGERKRWQIGAALHAQPDVLLLDEPSNHLDREGVECVRGALKRYRGIGILVSHDRALLDSLTTTTLLLGRDGLKTYPGNYSAARDAQEEEQALLRETHDRFRAKEKDAKRRLRDARNQHAAADAAKSSKKRMKNRKDSDARSASAKARATKGEARLGRSVAISRRVAQDASERRSEIRVAKDKGRSIFVDYKPAPMSSIVSVTGEEIRAGNKLICRDLRVQIRRETRARLVGANGAGKTTLMRALMRAAGSRREDILYLPQDPPRPKSLEAEEQVFHILAALGVDPGRFKRSEHASPGELRKFLLARGLARGAWALILDEPTNHMDLPSVERLQSALADYPGALLLVTHDDAFAGALTDQTWRLVDGALLLG